MHPMLEWMAPMTHGDEMQETEHSLRPLVTMHLPLPLPTALSIIKAVEEVVGVDMQLSNGPEEDTSTVIIETIADKRFSEEVVKFRPGKQA